MSTDTPTAHTAAKPADHRITYRILNERTAAAAERAVDVHATRDELAHLEREGYVLRERVVQGELLVALRGAADAIEAEYRPRSNVNAPNFGGLFVRNLIDKHPAFRDLLLRFPPLLSVARAVLGPQVQVHASVLRVSYPDERHQAVEWHFHQRVVPEPRPAFFSRPGVLDHLIYLDDITPDSGPLVVVPRTHLVDQALPAGDFADKPGQVVVTCPAGSVVTSHASLWHRAMAPKPGATRRRLLILGHSPTWMKQVDKPSAGAGRGLTDELMADADEEIRELLGLSGFF